MKKTTQLFPGLQLVEAYPFFNAAHDSNWQIVIGYQFKPSLKNYLIVEEYCLEKINPVMRKTTGFADLYTVSPPFIKSPVYFEKLKQEIEITEKLISSK